MGYYTSYSIEVDKTELEEEITNKICELSGYDDPFEGTCKWYDHQDHVTEVSQLYPDVVITISGIGEEQPDMWKQYYKGGKMQSTVAKIIYDDYDESQLE